MAAPRADGQVAGTTLLERLERLEARMARIEAQPPTGPAADGPETPTHPAAEQRPSDDRFWALDELKERVDEPGGILFTGSVSTPEGGHFEWQQAHATAALLDDDWSESVGRLTALAHPVRLLLLQQVLHGAHTVGELSTHERLGTTGQLYHHLRQLVAAGWLRAAGHGRYDVPGERLVPLLVVLAAARR